MPVVVAVVARHLLAQLVVDALRLLVPAGLGLLVLLLLAGQSVAVDSLSSSSARAEFYRPLIASVSLRAAVNIKRDATGQPLLDEDGDFVYEPQPPDPVTGEPPDAVPVPFLLALAEVLTDFDPLSNCLDPRDPTRPQPDLSAR